MSDTTNVEVIMPDDNGTVYNAPDGGVVSASDYATERDARLAAERERDALQAKQHDLYFHIGQAAKERDALQKRCDIFQRGLEAEQKDCASLHDEIDALKQQLAVAEHERHITLESAVEMMDAQQINTLTAKILAKRERKAQAADQLAKEATNADKQ